MAFGLLGHEYTNCDKIIYYIKYIFYNTLTGLFNVTTFNGMNITHYLFDTYFRLGLYLNKCNNWEVLFDDWG